MALLGSTRESLSQDNPTIRITDLHASSINEIQVCAEHVYQCAIIISISDSVNCTDNTEQQVNVTGLPDLTTAEIIEDRLINFTPHGHYIPQVSVTQKEKPFIPNMGWTSLFNNASIKQLEICDLGNSNTLDILILFPIHPHQLFTEETLYDFMLFYLNNAITIFYANLPEQICTKEEITRSKVFNDRYMAQLKVLAYDFMSRTKNTKKGIDVRTIP